MGISWSADIADNDGLLKQIVAATQELGSHPDVANFKCELGWKTDMTSEELIGDWTAQCEHSKYAHGLAMVCPLLRPVSWRDGCVWV